MTISKLLEQVSRDVASEDFHAVCKHLGRFAAIQNASLRQLPTQTSLLHEPHPSGITLFYVSTEQFAPRRHGTWCVLSPLQERVDVQSWIEFIPPAEVTGNLVAHAAPDVHYRCEVGSGLLVPGGQMFNIVANHRIEVLLLFGEHPNHTWPETRTYVATQHTEKALIYPETMTATTCRSTK